MPALIQWNPTYCSPRRAKELLLGAFMSLTSSLLIRAPGNFETRHPAVIADGRSRGKVIWTRTEKNWGTEMN